MSGPVEKSNIFLHRTLSSTDVLIAFPEGLDYRIDWTFMILEKLLDLKSRSSG